MSETYQAKQIDNVQSTVDRKIAVALAQVDQKLSSASGDIGMSDVVEERVGAIEARLSQMEQVVQTQHTPNAGTSQSGQQQIEQHAEPVGPTVAGIPRSLGFTHDRAVVTD